MVCLTTNSVKKAPACAVDGHMIPASGEALCVRMCDAPHEFVYLHTSTPNTPHPPPKKKKSNKPKETHAHITKRNSHARVHIFPLLICTFCGVCAGWRMADHVFSYVN